ncbi:MAG TPA: response regulator [Bryobacteraceae bacterium]|nr:response regulator [Bryobacteraceae bacterium]
MAAEGAKHKIVIVEDEGLIAADLEARLKMAGYVVPGTVDSANKALQLIRQTSPDLVLMDIRLKGKTDGIDVADQLREHFDIPVVFLTAYEDRGTLERAGRTQAFGYIKKPIASASLKGSIEMAIAKHRYERDLRAQRDWAIASFGAVPYAVLVTDGQGRVTYVNSQAEELTGWPVGKALSRSCWELLRLYYRLSGNPVPDLVPVAMLQGETIPLPEGISHKRDAKSSIAVEGSVAPRWRDGRVEGTVVALSDVTRSVFDEDQARQDEKHEALLRLAGGIVRQLPESGQMAEENPRLLETLAARMPMRPESEVIERVAVEAFTTASRLRALLQVAEVSPERVEIHPLLQRIEEAWKLVEPRLHLELDLKPVSVQADSWQLTRVLISILLHARSRSKSDTPLSIELSSAEPEQIIHSVRIRVSYTTAEENSASMERIFEPTWTGPWQDLHVAYKLVKKMGGLVAARLERGDQAIVDIYLPRVEAEAAGVTAPKTDEPAILLVDANAEVRRLLYAHFERNGYKLLATAGCEEAWLLAALYRGSIPLAIANLPAGDAARGWLSERLVALRPDIGVRLLSGYSEPCQAKAGAAFPPAPERHLTKWDLLEWAKESLAASQEAQL